MFQKQLYCVDVVHLYINNTLNNSQIPSIPLIRNIIIMHVYIFCDF